MEFLNTLLEHLVPVVVSIVLPILGYFVSRAVATFRAKTGLQVSQTSEQLLTDVITNAVLAAEQWALAKVKAGEAKPSGAEKLDQALDFVDAEVERLGLVDLATDVLKAKIESVVFERLNS